MSQIEKLAARYNVNGCAKDFLRASASPFEAPAGCLPAHMMNPQSRKSKYFVQGTFRTGTGAGITSGWISLAPDNLASDAAGAASPIVTSSSTTVNNVVGTSATAGAVLEKFPTEFATASFAAGQLEYRVVAAGLRIQNVSAALYREGTTFALTEPSHATVQGMAETDMAKYDEVIIEPEDNGKGWCTLLYNGPVNAVDFDYSPGFGVIGPCMGFIVKCTGANPQTYRYEAVVHVEWTGRLATGKTPTYSDPTATGIVASAVKQAHATCGKTDHNHPAFFSALGSALHKGIQMVSPLVQPALKLAARGVADAIPYAPAVLDAAQFAYPIVKSLMSKKSPNSGSKKMIQARPPQKLIKQKKR